MNRALAFAASLLFLSPCVATADYGVRDEGSWPATWPKELDGLRAQSRTLEGPLVLLLHYAIPFAKREEFETSWPHLLKVKSPARPDRAHTWDKLLAGRQVKGRCLYPHTTWRRGASRREKCQKKLGKDRLHRVDRRR